MRINIDCLAVWADRQLTLLDTTVLKAGSCQAVWCTDGAAAEAYYTMLYLGGELGSAMQSLKVKVRVPDPAAAASVASMRT
jgi:hypothetical protein